MGKTVEGRWSMSGGDGWDVVVVRWGCQKTYCYLIKIISGELIGGYISRKLLYNIK